MTDIHTKKNTNEYFQEYNRIIVENDKIYRKLEKSLGLSDCAFWILYILRTEKNVDTQSELSNCLFVPKQTINSALKKLESDGYIEMSNQKDLRSKHLRLTDAGVKFCKQTVDFVIKAEMDTLAELSDDELMIFFQVFRKYTNLFTEKIQEICRNKEKKSK